MICMIHCSLMKTSTIMYCTQQLRSKSNSLHHPFCWILKGKGGLSSMFSMCCTMMALLQIHETV